MHHTLFTGLLLTSTARSAATNSRFTLPVPSNITNISPFSTLKQPYYPPAASCQDYMIPVDVEFDRYPFNGTKWNNDYDLTDFLSVVTTRAGADYPSVLGDTVKEQATYQIAASFCTPLNPNGKEKTVILATHGIGPARAHWNSPYEPDNYNFVQQAINEGYSVFFYDRLGCGASQKISGYDAQINTAIAVLSRLAQFVRAGQYTGSIGKPTKLALIGFSFGSYTTHGAVSLNPDIADAVILTAIGFNKTGLNINGLVRSYMPRIAALQNETLFGDRDYGYLTWVDTFAQIWNYFKEPNYDPEVATWAEIAKSPFAVAEFLTLLSGPQDVSNYTGAALHITGDHDYIFCDGYCYGIYNEPASKIYRNAKLELALHPGASHNINLHRNATGAYKVITDFLDRNGL